MEEGFFSAAEARRVKPTASLLPRCESCGLYKDCMSPKMAPTGKGRKRILICGDYPGKQEDDKGYQYAGGAGDWLEYQLKQVQIDMREDCRLTNATICFTKEPGLHKTAIDDCRPNLLNTIRDFNPEIIFLLGGTAVKSLIGHIWKSDVGPISKWVGWRIPVQKINTWVCPFNNPAHLTREKNPVLDRQFRTQLELAAQLQGRPWPDGPPNYEAQVELIMDSDEAANRIERYTSGLVAFDYETTCIKPDIDSSRLVCASVCWNGKETIAFPWHGRRIKEAMADLLENPDVGKIGWNLKFEHRWTKAKLGVSVRGWRWDGMLANHSMDPRGVSGLKFQSFVRLGASDYNSHIEPLLESTQLGEYAPNRIDEIGLPQLLKYCGLDSLYEFHVSRIQAKEMGVDLFSPR